ncbi:MAG TPA: HAD-IB family phosphatase [Terriglobia bacterium]|nr:HAD-IB family phosphatase [Terriglobia bacterium]
MLASDFDQTLSFHDSGLVLSELVGIPAKDFEKKTAILAVQNLVQQGAELAYLLLHDPEYRARVRKEHLAEAGKRIRLKKNIPELVRLLKSSVEGYEFDFRVISAAPQKVIESALEGVVPADHIYGTQLVYDKAGRIESLVRVSAGYGKVAVLDDLQAKLQVSADRIIYVGDGSSDIHVMLHVNRRKGYTIAVSESKTIAQIARRTVSSDNALSVLVPILEEIAGWDPARIRAFFEENGLLIREWDKSRTDWLTIGQAAAQPVADPEKIDALDPR